MELNKRFRGGSSKAEAPTPVAPYDPTTDPGYQRAIANLDKLKPGFEKANHRMTQAEIIASLPGLQQALLQSQLTQPQASPTANWGAVNNLLPQQQMPQFTPVQAPQYQGGLFNGPNSVNPANLQTPAQNFVYLTSLLGQPTGGSK
jgi:hypothetical protein